MPKWEKFDPNKPIDLVPNFDKKPETNEVEEQEVVEDTDLGDQGGDQKVEDQTKGDEVEGQVKDDVDKDQTAATDGDGEGDTGNSEVEDGDAGDQGGGQDDGGDQGSDQLGLFDEDDSEDEKDEVSDNGTKDQVGDDNKVPSFAGIKIGEETYDVERASASIKKLNEIEKDEFLSKFTEHYLNGGDPMDYLKANLNTVNVESPLDLARFAFDQEHDGLDAETKQILWEQRVSDVYQRGKQADEDGIDGPTPQLIKVGEARMKQDAAKGKKLLEEQKKNFKLAKKEAAMSDEDMKSRIQEAIRMENKRTEDNLRAFRQKVFEDSSTKRILKDGKIVVQYGDQKLAYQVQDKNKVVESASDIGKFLGLVSNEKGIDVVKFNKLVAIAEDIERYDRTLIEHGMRNSKKAVLGVRKNIKKVEDGGGAQTRAKTQEQKNIASLKEAAQRGWTSIRK